MPRAAPSSPKAEATATATAAAAASLTSEKSVARPTSPTESLAIETPSVSSIAGMAIWPARSSEFSAQTGTSQPLNANSPPSTAP